MVGEEEEVQVECVVEGEVVREVSGLKNESGA